MNLTVLEQQIKDDMGRGKHLGEEGEDWQITLEGETALVTPTWDRTKVIAYTRDENGAWKLALELDA